MAGRLSGLPHDNLFSITHKPWFDFSTYHYFKPTDFIPVPKVDAIMWRIRQKELPLVPYSERNNFCEFVTSGFGQGELISKNLIKWAGKDKYEKIQGRLSFSLRVKPGYLDLEKWIKVYESFKETL